MPDATFMDQYIKDGKTETISLKNLYESMLMGSVDRPEHVYRVPIGDFFIKHHDDIADAIQLYQVPEGMFYKPKMVSMDIYGTTELWLALLRVNGMRNITEFHQPIIRVYNPNMLRDYIDIFFKREKKIT